MAGNAEELKDFVGFDAPVPAFLFQFVQIFNIEPDAKKCT